MKRDWRILRILPGLILAVLLLSCQKKNNRENQREYKQNEIVAPYDRGVCFRLKSSGIDSLVSRCLPRWSHYYAIGVPTIHQREFIVYDSATIEPEEIEPLPEGGDLAQFLNLYSPYLIWQNDRNKAVDIFSYNISLQNSLDGRIHAYRDVDSQLSVLDFKKKIKTVIMTLGPSIELQEGFWLNRGLFIIAFLEKNRSGRGIPGLMMVDLCQNKILYFQYSGNTRVKQGDYIHRKFTGVVF